MKQKVTFKPAPGIIVAIPLVEDKTSSLTITSQQKSQLKVGTIIALGDTQLTDGNALIDPKRYGKIGDTIYFLSYDGHYDDIVIDGQQYYMFKVQDARSVVLK